jgi:hypothetical protein
MLFLCCVIMYDEGSVVSDAYIQLGWNICKGKRVAEPYALLREKAKPEMTHLVTDDFWIDNDLVCVDDFWVSNASIFINNFCVYSSICALMISASAVELDCVDDF